MTRSLVFLLFGLLVWQVYGMEEPDATEWDSIPTESILIDTLTIDLPEDSVASEDKIKFIRPYRFLIPPRY